MTSISGGFAMDFLESETVEQNLTFKYAKETFKKCNVKFDINKMKSLGMMTPEGSFTNLGFLLSDQCSWTIKTAFFTESDQFRFQDRQEFGGSLFQQMDNLFSYLNLQNQTRSTIDGLRRIDIRDYPEEALREAMMNALVHRNYSFKDSNLVKIHHDRIEFISVGGLAEGVEKEDIMTGLSICRNPKLADVFSRLKLIEAFGTGISLIFETYKGFPLQPTVEVTSNVFKITLPNRNNTNSNPRTTLGKGNETRILEYLEKKPYVMRNEVEQLLGVSQATSNRILKRMLDEKWIVQEGNGRTTKYHRA